MSRHNNNGTPNTQIVHRTRFVHASRFERHIIIGTRATLLDGNVPYSDELVEWDEEAQQWIPMKLTMQDPIHIAYLEFGLGLLKNEFDIARSLNGQHQVVSFGDLLIKRTY
jgi:hypothetical protein